ncbi:MAG: hypothetical protein GEV03_12690 [Streptosporangiales bacterium]|nr:hypothetical protein [Streptosporangiales bacterium]
MVGGPDPLEVLPQLENELEAVAGSTAQVREMAAGFRSTADDLETEAGAVTWEGEASDQFRSKTAEVAQSLRTAADNLDAAADQDDDSSEEIKDTIRKILQGIAVTAALVGAILVFIAVGWEVAAIVMVLGALFLAIAALAEFIAFFLDQIWWLGEKLYEGIKIILENVDDVLRGAGDVADRVLDTVGDAADSVLDSAGDAADSVLDTGGDAADSVLDSAGDVADDLGDTIGGPAEPIGDAADSVLDTAGDVVEGGLDTAGDVVEGGLDTVGDAADTILPG